MSAAAVPSDIAIEPLTGWLYCLRTPARAKNLGAQPAARADAGG